MPNDLKAHHTTIEIKPRKKLPGPTEHQIQTQIINFLQHKGYYVQRMNSGALRDRRNHLIRLNRAGTPDVMAFKRLDPRVVGQAGRLRATEPKLDLLFVEVKRPGNPPTETQIRVMKELEEHGARCLVAHSVEEVEEAIA
jgi:hypothetical protein